MIRRKLAALSISLGLILVMLILILSDTAIALVQDPIESATKPAQLMNASFLSGPINGDPLDIALAFITDNASLWNLTGEDLSDIRITDNYQSDHTGTSHIYLRQRFEGLDVHGANMNINVAADGSIVNVGNSFVSDLADSAAVVEPVITAQEAVHLSAESAGVQISEPLRADDRLTTNEENTVVFEGADFSLSPVPTDLVYFVLGDAVHLAWNVQIYELNAQHYWNTYIDAQSGAVLSQTDQVVHDTWSSSSQAVSDPIGDFDSILDITSTLVAVSEALSGTYNVYSIPIESPSHAENGPLQDGRTLVVEPANELASPYGWHDDDGIVGEEFTTTQGNNAHAYTDTNNSNTPDSGSSPNGGTDLLFDFALNLTGEPSAYRPAAVTNLFYWNNIMHDVSYLYGFDEAAGNFQENNYGRGGNGSDYVRAEAQDSASLPATMYNRNNANFYTPPDGDNPRMQMYLWTLTEPRRDGDLDNGIVTHEYGHGISNRLVGGPSLVSCLQNSEQMGEGWSDWQSVIFTLGPSDSGESGRGIGTYALGEDPDGPGIRLAKYSTDFAVNDYTYGDLHSPSIRIPHDVGFIWNTMLWEVLWALIDKYGFNPDIYGSWSSGGNNLAHQLVTDGMKLVNCSPGFVNGRDAILTADQLLTGGANQCLIWEAFAKRGLGANAVQGSANVVGDEIEDFSLPYSCSDRPVIELHPESSSVEVELNSQFTDTISINNSGSSTLTWSISEANPHPQANAADSENIEDDANVGLSLDDGSRENSIGGVGQFVWFNRFTPASSELPLELSEVRVLFTSSTSVGDDIEIVLHADTDGDNNPGTGASHLATYHGSIQASDNSTWSSYFLSPTIIFEGPGDLLIGVVNRYNMDENSADFPAALDETTSNGRSWAATYNTASVPNPVSYPSDNLWGTIDSFGYPGNWMIRAFGNVQCSNINDISWLSISPNSGEVVATGSALIELAYDTTGLPLGDHQGELCILSNDQDNPRVLLPVSMTVEIPGNQVLDKVIYIPSVFEGN